MAAAAILNFDNVNISGIHTIFPPNLVDRCITATCR